MDANYQMSAASNQDGGDGSDMDEPMASQGQVGAGNTNSLKVFTCNIQYILYILFPAAYEECEYSTQFCGLVN